MASNDRNTQNSNAQNAQGSASQNARGGNVGDEQSARSEEQLDREERSLIGNTAEDRNLSGSTTYVTLPDQQGDESQDQSSRQGSSKSGGSQQDDRGESYGSARGDTQR
jgi:hypothetical protein